MAPEIPHETIEKRAEKNKVGCEPRLAGADVWCLQAKPNGDIPGIARRKAEDLICGINCTIDEVTYSAPEISHVTDEKAKRWGWL